VLTFAGILRTPVPSCFVLFMPICKEHAVKRMFVASVSTAIFMCCMNHADTETHLQGSHSAILQNYKTFQIYANFHKLPASICTIYPANFIETTDMVQQRE